MMKRTLAALGGTAFLSVVIASAASEDRYVTLALSTDQSAYYVGEPVRLTLAVRNESDHTLEGFFDLRPPDDRIVIFYRRTGKELRRFARRVSEDHDVRILRAPMKVMPHEERRSELPVAMDPVTRSLLLNEPGRYEFYVECRPWDDEKETVLRSDITVVRVEPPPDQQKEALAEYLASGLPILVQAWPFPMLDKNSIAESVAFLERHPVGPYSDNVRRALVNGLRHRVLRKEASIDERELYQRLRGADAPE